MVFFFSDGWMDLGCLCLWWFVRLRFQKSCSGGGNRHTVVLFVMSLVLVSSVQCVDSVLHHQSPSISHHESVVSHGFAVMDAPVQKECSSFPLSASTFGLPIFSFPLPAFSFGHTKRQPQQVNDKQGYDHGNYYTVKDSLRPQRAYTRSCQKFIGMEALSWTEFLTIVCLPRHGTPL